MQLLSICVIFLIITSCKSFVPSLLIVRLTPNPDKPVLVDNSEANEAVLMIQHYRWILKAATDRYLVGEITEDEYNEKKEIILNIISKFEISDKQ